MPPTRKTVQDFIPFTGGLNTVVPPGILTPHDMDRSSNIIYELGGIRRKRSGQTYLNSTVLESGADVTGAFDYWKDDTSQRLVCHVGTVIKTSSDLGATWSDIKTGLQSGKIPSYSVFNGNLITASDSTVDVPQTWAQSGNTSNLGGSPPNFSFSAVHRNRLFAGGVSGNLSRLYYCAALNEADWTTVNDAGNIDIDPGDGDYLTGFVGNYLGELIIFKNSSYHVLTGSSPTGSDAFARVPKRRGIGSINHNGIVTQGNDVYFVSRHGIHSLGATEQFGDLQTTYLSAPIQNKFNGLNLSRLKYCWGVNNRSTNTIWWTFSDGGQSENNLIFAYNYTEKKWSILEGINAACLAGYLGTSSAESLMTGRYDGYLAKQLRANRIDFTSTAITGLFQIPSINMGQPYLEKRWCAIYIHYKPMGDYNMTMTTRIDNKAETSYTVSQGGGGAVLGSFVLGTSRLGAGNLNTKAVYINGVGRNLSLEFSQNGSDQDMQIYGISVEADLLGVPKD